MKFIEKLKKFGSKLANGLKKVGKFLKDSATTILKLFVSAGIGTVGGIAINLAKQTVLVGMNPVLTALNVMGIVTLTIMASELASQIIDGWEEDIKATIDEFKALNQQIREKVKEEVIKQRKAAKMTKYTVVGGTEA